MIAPTGQRILAAARRRRLLDDVPIPIIILQTIL